MFRSDHRCSTGWCVGPSSPSPIESCVHTHRTGSPISADGGARVRVVSMPCMELFEAQSQDYRDQVLPPAVRARLAVEPGASMSWWKWVGIDGQVLGLDRFGASAPGSTVLQELGFSVENILARARALLQSSQ
jgi:transketolase